MDYSQISSSLLALPILSKEEEASLGKSKNELKKRIDELKERFNGITDKKEKRTLSKEIKKLREEYKTLADYFISHHLRLPFYIARRYFVSENDFDDYIAEGNAALYRAFNFWNPDIAKFSTYACSVIKKTYWSFSKRNNYRNSRARFASIESDSEGEGLIKCIEAKNEEVSLGLAIEDRERILSDALFSLNKRERTIVESRYGWNGQEILTLENSGRLIGVTKERARQIQKRAIEKIRDYINDRYGEEARLILQCQDS